MFLITAFIKLSLVLAINASDSTDQQMFLCLDSMMQNYKQGTQNPQKLVYSYIDGKKTGCMTEYELRELLSKTAFEKQRSSQPDSQKILELSGRKLTMLPLSAREAVYKGKKDLVGADLSRCDLKGLDLTGADLRNANLQTADLRNAKLTNANLTGAKLDYAYFKNADLNGADLTNCSLKGTYFHHANLVNVKGITHEGISSTASVYKATLDQDLAEIVKTNCPNKLKDPGWQWLAPQLVVEDSVSNRWEHSKRKIAR
ncbi:MAG: pentapeptide repeat-containing protein [Fibrobacter sp.]|nr:pentapeptide repeat-containing protein [Fibrobacter sp.]